MEKSGNSTMQMEQWSTHTNVLKYVQFNQHSLSHYIFEAKAPIMRYSTKIYKRLQVREREVKELSFDLNSERKK